MMKKTEIINLIKNNNPKLAKDMKNPNFLGWVIFTVYLNEKGNMRDLKIVIEEFCEQCYSLLEQGKAEIPEKFNEVNNELKNRKGGKTLCQVAMNIVKDYDKFSIFLAKVKEGLGIQDDCGGFVGVDFNEKQSD